MSNSNKNIIKYLSKKNIYLVFGLGTTGMAATYFLQKNNYNFYVSDDDTKKLKNLTVDNKVINEAHKIYELSKKILKEKKINFIVLSPSIHAQNNPHKIINIANKLSIKIIPDIDLFYEYMRQYNTLHKTNKKIIAITGTNGKSTTTALTEFLFNQLNKKAIACGNNGLNTLSLDIKKYDLFITEMSSYNLFLLKNTLFETSVLLNITNDHLDYHGSIENYINAKFKAIKQAKIKILCIDDKNILNFLKKNYHFRTKNAIQKIDNNSKINDIVYISTKQILDNGLSWKKNTFYYNGKQVFHGTFNNLPGLHNVENILSSVACVVKTLNIDDLKDIENIFKKIDLFQGLPHRLQFVKKIDKIYFINDSKATNADSTKKALQALKNNNIYLIAGGQRKTDGFLSIKNDLKDVKHVYLIGEASESFSQELDHIGIKYTNCDNMTNAVFAAAEEAKKNIYLNKDKNKRSKTVILLSPLCASWDQYKSFEERGDDFIKIVSSMRRPLFKH